MKTGWLLAILGTALVLSGCGKSGEAGNNASAPTGAPVAAVAAPAGTRWSETIAETPAGGFMMGNPNAAIKVVEYGSLTCPHCAEFAKESEADEVLAKNYVDTGKVSFEYRQFVRDPLDLAMGMVARCGGKDPFFSMTHQLYANQADMFTGLQAKGDEGYKAAMQAPPNQRFVKLAELAGLIDFAKARGVPEPQVRACLANVATAETIAKGNDTATKDFNVQGTPTLIMNGKVLENVATWPTLEAKLKEAGA